MKWRPTVRVRFMLLYAAFFLATGILLIATTHLLYRERLLDQPDRGRQALVDAFGERLPSGRRLEEFLSRDGRTLARFVDDFQRDVLDDALRDQLVQSLIALVCATGGALALGWVAAGRALRPLQQITETARASSESDLRHRVGMTGPDDELKDLADTLDELLEALDESFASQRSFAANVAHELRTPLAVLRAEADIRLASPDLAEDERGFARRVLSKPPNAANARCRACWPSPAAKAGC